MEKYEGEEGKDVRAGAGAGGGAALRRARRMGRGPTVDRPRSSRSFFSSGREAVSHCEGSMSLRSGQGRGSSARRGQRREIND